MFKKLRDREIKGHPQKPLDVCYVVFCDTDQIHDLEYMKVFFSGDPQSPDISEHLRYEIAFDTERRAEQYILDYLENRLNYCRGFSLIKFKESKDKNDLEENAYWIIEIAGKAKEVTAALRSAALRSEQPPKLNEKIISIKNNLENIHLLKKGGLSEEPDAKTPKPS
ncbi:MAG TPA: hypothetical protein VHE99_01335 [Gammaproteobacteria bacterium]|nr:hypothetical protein [Gammaproteobacteria bacterium]